MELTQNSTMTFAGLFDSRKMANIWWLMKERMEFLCKDLDAEMT